MIITLKIKVSLIGTLMVALIQEQLTEMPLQGLTLPKLALMIVNNMLVMTIVMEVFFLQIIILQM